MKSWGSQFFTNVGGETMTYYLHVCSLVSTCPFTITVNTKLVNRWSSHRHKPRELFIFPSNSLISNIIGKEIIKPGYLNSSSSFTLSNASQLFITIRRIFTNLNWNISKAKCKRSGLNHWTKLQTDTTGLLCLPRRSFWIAPGFILWIK